MTLNIRQTIASNSAVQESDVYALKTALNRLGYYTSYEKVGMIGIPDADMFYALGRGCGGCQ